MLASSIGTSILSEAEIQTYEREGALVPAFRWPQAELIQLQDMARKLDSENPGLLKRPLISPHVSRSGVKTDPEVWMRAALHPSILDIMEELLGPDLILYGAVVFFKKPAVTPVTRFHQDGPHFPIVPLKAAIAWLAIFDSVIENGCLQIIPGTHRQTFKANKELGLGTFVEADCISDDDLDLSRVRDVELEAGQIVIFDSMLVHGARPNQGVLPRAGYAIRFMPSTSVYDYKLAERQQMGGGNYNRGPRPIFLARGVDRSGKNEFGRGI